MHTDLGAGLARQETGNAARSGGHSNGIINRTDLGSDRRKDIVFIIYHGGDAEDNAELLELHIGCTQAARGNDRDLAAGQKIRLAPAAGTEFRLSQNNGVTCLHQQVYR